MKSTSPIDRLIMGDLVVNSPSTVREIAQRIGVNRQSVYRRINKLASQGKIAINSGERSPNMIKLDPSFSPDAEPDGVDRDPIANGSTKSTPIEPLEPAIYSACLLFLQGKASAKRKALIIGNPHFKATTDEA